MSEADENETIKLKEQHGALYFRGWVALDYDELRPFRTLDHRRYEDNGISQLIHTILKYVRA